MPFDLRYIFQKDFYCLKFSKASTNGGFAIRGLSEHKIMFLYNFTIFHLVHSYLG